MVRTRLSRLSRLPPIHEDECLRETPTPPKFGHNLTDLVPLKVIGTSIYLARSCLNKRLYAIRGFRKTALVTLGHVKATNDEVFLLKEIRGDNPFIIGLWSTFQDTTYIYMVVDYAAGGSLRDLLKRAGRFPDPVAKFYAGQIILVLEYLHERDISLGNLSLKNILLFSDGSIKIQDFFEARRLGSRRERSKAITSDLCDLGKLIFEMLTGLPPKLSSAPSTGQPIATVETTSSTAHMTISVAQLEIESADEDHISSDVRNLIIALIDGRPDTLTCCAVKGHAWFQEVPWDRMWNKELNPPYRPPSVDEDEDGEVNGSSSLKSGGKISVCQKARDISRFPSFEWVDT